MQNIFRLSEQEQEFLSTGKFYLGIDPGLSGAVAVLDENATLINLIEMPIMAKGKGKSIVKTQINAAALNDLLMPYIHAAACIENVTARPGNGIASMFSLGDSVGVIRGVCVSLKMQIHYVTPPAWKKYYKLPSDKEYARAKAIELYPQASLHRKKDHGRAEAILLARYGYEVFYK